MWLGFVAWLVRSSTPIKQHFGNRPFRVGEAVAAGIPRHAIYRLRDEGALLTLSRGVLQSVDSDPAMNTEFAALAARVPKATICLNSGLSYWDLSDELPASIHLAVPRGAHWPTIDTPATTLHRFAAETFELERLGADAPMPASRSGSTRPNAASSTRCACSTSSAATSPSRRCRATPGAADADPLRLNALARRLGGARRMSEALELILA